MHLPLWSLCAAAWLCLTLLAVSPAQAFCGIYVAKADGKLFNKASRVVVARSGEQTAVTMASDYAGDPREFALVIPVPTVVTPEQIQILESALLDQLDAYSAPRLVEYFDPDPCQPPATVTASAMRLTGPHDGIEHRYSPATLGVTIEAQYTVGEYDIQILSAAQCDGLAQWLSESGYKIPPEAVPVLGSYIKQSMKFFLARVNLKERGKLGYRQLRPIQVRYATHKFMLPIRLGTANGKGAQDMIVLVLTEKGRVETTNYRTVKVPSDVELPVFTKADFANFYRVMFDRQVQRDDMRVVYLEYAWDTGWCDPCAADPLPTDKLAALGAVWLTATATRAPRMGGNVFITRLHVRYDASHFPEDLMFQETSDRSNFQGRYILRHPYIGAACPQAQDYYRALTQRFDREAGVLSGLTGWELAAIKEKMRNGLKERR
jgi:hypothetical protein